MSINTKAEKAVPVERLHQLFFYNSEIGTLIHRNKKGAGLAGYLPLGRRVQSTKTDI